MRYKVTGGKDGISGIEVAGRRYEAGSTVELTAAKAAWLLEEGYLVSESAANDVETEIVEEL